MQAIKPDHSVNYKFLIDVRHFKLEVEKGGIYWSTVERFHVYKIFIVLDRHSS